MSTSEPEPSAASGPEFISLELAERLGKFVTAATEGLGVSLQKFSEQVLADEARRAQLLSAFQLPKLAQDVNERVAKALEPLRHLAVQALPSNWPPSIGSRLDDVLTIIQHEGIPLTHVPRAEIVTVLLDASTAEARLSVLRDRHEEIAQDCRDALRGSIDAPELADQLPLARDAVDTFIAGHHLAAQALAVNVCDTYLKAHMMRDASTGRNISYDKLAQQVAIDDDAAVSIGTLFRILYAFAPIAQFLAHWNPDSKNPGPAPARFSRHASIHGASADVYQTTNATVAIMLVTSLTVALDLTFQKASATAP